MPGARIYVRLPMPSHPLHLSPPALGVQLLQYVLLLKLHLEDGTDSLQALLWQDAVRESGRSGCHTHAHTRGLLSQRLSVPQRRTRQTHWPGTEQGPPSACTSDCLFASLLWS